MCLNFFTLALSQHHHYHYSHSEEYHTESSRGSDLSDIMEEDEEDLYSEMQLEEGRRRSINSHNTLKVLTAHLQPLVAPGEDRGGWGGKQGFREDSCHLQSYLLLSHRLYNQAPCGFDWLSSPPPCIS